MIDFIELFYSKDIIFALFAVISLNLIFFHNKQYQQPTTKQVPSKLPSAWFSHIWTIDNYDRFYDNNHESREYPFVYSENFSPFVSECLNAYIELCPKGFDEYYSEYVSVFVCLDNHLETKEVKVKCAISVLDSDGNELCTKEHESSFDRFSRLSFNDFIQQAELFDSQKKILGKNKLTIYCEVELTFEENACFRMRNLDEKFCPASKKFDAEQMLVPLAHQWTVENFDHFNNASIAESIFSDCFKSSENQTFFLGLCINNDNAIYSDHLLISVNLKNGDINESNVQFRLSLLDSDGKKCFSIGSHETITSGSNCGWYIIKRCDLYDLRNKFLIDNKLKIYCEIQTINNFSDIELFGNANDRTLENVTESYSNVTPKIIDSFVHIWMINFKHLYQNENEKFQLIDSKEFTSKIYEQIVCKLILYPNADCEERNKHFSIYLCNLANELSDEVQCLLSILDAEGNKYNTKVIRWKFEENVNAIGWSKYISVEELFNNFLIDDKFKVHCEVKIIETRNTKSETVNYASKSNSSSVTKSYFYSKNIELLDYICHEWVIENLNYYLNNENIYKHRFIKSKKFASIFNHELQFYMCFFPNGLNVKFEEFSSLYLYCDTSKNVNVHCSFLIRGDSGAFLKVKEKSISFNQNKIGHGWSKFLNKEAFKEKYLNNQKLTIYCEIQIIEDKNRDLIKNYRQNALTTISPERITQSYFNLKPTLIDFFSHRFSIRNFQHFIKYKTLHSSIIYSTKNQNYRFYIELHQNIDSNNEIYCDLFLRNISLHYNEFFVNCRISIFNFRTKYFSKAKTFKFCNYMDYLGWEKCIKIDGTFEKMPVIGILLTLYCEIELLDEINNESSELLAVLKQQEKNKNALLQATASYFDANIDDSGSFVLKWTIHNFQNFCNDKNFVIAHSIPFTTEYHGNQSNYILELEFNDDDIDYRYMKIYLRSNELGLLSCAIYCEISILKENSEKCYSKKYVWNFFEANKNGDERYILISDILNSENNMFLNENLVIQCTGKVIELNKSKTIDSNYLTQNYNTFYDETTTKLALITHKWTLENYISFLDANLNDKFCFKTATFHPMFNEDIDMYLALVSNNTNTDSSISVSLVFQLNKTRLWANMKISIIDQFGNICETKANVSKFGRFYTLKFDKFTTNCHLKSQASRLLPNGNLTIFFEGIILSNYKACEHDLSINNPRKNENSDSDSDSDSDDVDSDAEPLEYYSIDDFKFEWKVTKLSNKVSQHESITNLKMCQCSELFRIDNFSQIFLCYDQKIETSEFYPADCEERFFLEASSHKENNCFQLCLKSLPLTENAIDIQFKLFLLDQNENRIIEKVGCNQIFEKECLEWSEYISYDDILNSEFGPLQNDSLLVHCEIKIFLYPQCRTVETPRILILQELNDSLHYKQLTDVVLICGAEQPIQLHAHKKILSLRSDVFAAMFTHDMLEKEKSQIEIIDFGYEIVYELLRFIYTGRPYVNNDLLAIELFLAADKYNLVELRQICENWLCSNLSLEAADNILTFIPDIEFANNLRQNALQYKLKSEASSHS